MSSNKVMLIILEVGIIFMFYMPIQMCAVKYLQLQDPLWLCIVFLIACFIRTILKYLENDSRY
jgi:hypothetical protein